MAPQEPKFPCIPANEAAKRFGLTNDHISLLCRRGKVEASFVGRMWFVDENSLVAYLKQVEAEREARRKKQSELWKNAWAMGMALLLCLGISSLGPMRAEAFDLGPHADLQAPDFSLTQAVAQVGRLLGPSPTIEPYTSRPAALASGWQEPDYVPQQDVTAAAYEVWNSWTDWLSGFFSNSPAPAPTSSSPPTQPRNSVNTSDIGAAVPATHAAPPVLNPVTTVKAPAAAPDPSARVSNMPAPAPVAESKVTLDDFITKDQLTTQLQELANSLRSLIYSQQSAPNSLPASGGLLNNIALSNKIDQLSGVTISNSTISGTLSGLSASDIPDLSGSYFPATSTIAITFGGTGTSTAPNYGQLLLGNSSGGYDLVSTSSLGIVGGGSSVWSTSGSSAYYTSGNVGVGTTSPWAVLSVSSKAGSPQFVIGSSTTQFIVDKSGNVGVGTTSPAARFAVAGSTYLGGSLTVTGNLSLGNFTEDSTPACGNTYHTFIGSIGTVGGDECAALNVTQADTNGNVIYRFGGAGQPWAGEFYANSTLVGMNTKNTLPLTFQIDGSEKMRVDSTGNVGVGTTSPGSLLSIGTTGGINFSTGTSTFSSTGGINLASGCFAINGTCISGGGASSSASSTLLSDNNTFSGSNTFSSLFNLKGGLLSLASSTIGDGTQIGGLTINGGATTTGDAYFAGDVGIGTQSPSGYGAAGPILELKGTAASAPEITLDDTPLGGGSWTIVSDSGPSLYFVDTAHSNAKPFTLGDTGAAVAGNFTVTGNTNGQAVGPLIAQSTGGSNIGTALTLDATDNTGGHKYSFFSTGSNASVGAGSFAFYDGTRDAYDIMISSTGNVGIGTTSPSAPLSVSGNSYFDNGTTTVGSSGNVNFNNDFTYSASTGVTTISNLETGPLNFDTDAGNISWVNLPLSSASAGVQESYTAQIANTPILTVNGYADGSGGVYGTAVGVGSTTPWAKLSVQGNAGDTTGSLFSVASTTNTLFEITNAGTVGIGTTSPGALLSLSAKNGDTFTSNNIFEIASSTASATTMLFSVGNTGNAILAGTLTQNSDERLKTDVQSLSASSSLAAIELLNPVSYRWQDDIFGSRQEFGFIAQQVQKVFPQLVSTTSPTALTPGGTLGLNYSGLISPIVSALQEIGNVSGTFRQNLVAWFADAQNSIGKLFASEVDAGKLCAKKSDGTYVCVTGDQLASLLAVQGGGSTTSSQPVSSTTPDTTAPVITVNGANPAKVAVGGTYIDLGASVSDNVDHNLGLHASLDGGATTTLDHIYIDTSAPDEHHILYFATDQAGNTGYASREVIVFDPNASTASSTSSSTSTSTTPVAPLILGAATSTSELPASTASSTATTTQK